MTAPAERTTTSAEYSSCSITPPSSRSTTTVLTARPEPVVSSRTTREWVRSVTSGWARAGCTQTTAASALACTRQGNPSQVLQRMQADWAGMASSMRIPLGSGKGWSPALVRSAESCSMRGSWLMAGQG